MQMYLRGCVINGSGGLLLLAIYQALPLYTLLSVGIQVALRFELKAAPAHCCPAFRLASLSPDPGLGLGSAPHRLLTLTRTLTLT